MWPVVRARWGGFVAVVHAASLATAQDHTTNPIPDPIVFGNVTVGLREFGVGTVSEPTALLGFPDGSGRKIVSSQLGQVYLFDAAGHRFDTPFLDTSGSTVQTGSRGTTGIAFAPDFAISRSPGFGKFYTLTAEPPGTGVANFGTAGDHQAVLYEWRVSKNDPNLIDPASKRELLRIDVPADQHNVDDIAFGHDGYLYMSMGDGGFTNQTLVDPESPNNVWGKIWRLDVNDTSYNGRYSIPPDNPWANSTTGQIKELYATGFRNPYRISFDRATGDLWTGDVGQFVVEEIDKVTSGGDYGWLRKEGSFLYNRSDGTVSIDPDPDPNLINPVGEYDHDEGNAIIGGSIYRGTLIPELEGMYVFADWFSFAANYRRPRLMYMDPVTGAIKELRVDTPAGVLGAGATINGFSEDENGELYILLSNGQVEQLIPNFVAWASASDGAWVNSARWTSSLRPDEAVNVRFNIPGSYTIRVNRTGAAKSLVATAGNVTIDTRLPLIDSSGLSIGSNVIIAPFAGQAATITLRGGNAVNIAGSVAVGGTLVTRGGAGTLVINDTVRVDIAGTLKVWTHGRVQFQRGTLSAGTISVVGGRLDLDSGADKLLRTGALSINSSGTIDLADNDLLATASSVNAISALVARARNGGQWDGSGLTSSVAPDSFKSLAAISGRDYRAAHGASALFHNVAVSDTDVLVNYTYYGDTELNGHVDGADYAHIDTSFNDEHTQGNISGWFNGDFDYNGKVDGADYALIDAAFNVQTRTFTLAAEFLSGDNRSIDMNSSPALALVLKHFEQFGEPYATAFLNSIPEPSVAMVAFLAPGLLRHRYRRR